MSKTLNVPISEKTRRKLGALAILTGKKFDSMEAELAELLDGVLSLKIDEAMANIDGRELPSREQEEEAAAYTIKFPKDKKLSPKETDDAGDLVDDIAGHSLSSDMDEGAPSLEEQYEQEEQSMRSAPPRTSLPQKAQDKEFKVPEFSVENAGDDVEKFLEHLEQPPANPLRAQTVRERRATSPGMTSKPRVKVSDYSGVEEGDLF